MQVLWGVVALLLALPAAASRLDEIPERIELLGNTLDDAFHAECREEAPRIERELLASMRASAAERDRLKARCQAAYDGWSRSAARLDDGGEAAYAKLARYQQELLPCWDAIEAMQREIRSQARQCREQAGASLFPLGFSELDTQIELSSEVRCERRFSCTLPSRAVAARPPGWLGASPASVVLGFTPLGIERVLSSVYAVQPAASCDAARERLETWRDRLESDRPELRWNGRLGAACEPASLVAAARDHAIVLMLFEDSGRWVAGALAVHLPGQALQRWLSSR